MQRTIYFAKYHILNNSVKFNLYGNKNSIIIRNSIPNFCKGLKDKDLVLIEIELINNEISIKQILDVVDEKILWSNKTYDWNYQNQHLIKSEISKYGKTIGYPKKSLEFHTLKHPICDSYINRWKSLGINYASYNTIKNKYEEISKNMVINNLKRDWIFNNKHLSINYIDNNNLLVALKYNHKNKSVIATLHFNDQINNEDIEYKFFTIFNIIKNYSLEENYSFVKKTLSQAKRLQTRYYKDNKIDFYYSIYYDFDSMINALSRLRFCFNKIDNTDFHNLKEEYINFMLNCYEDDYDKMNLKIELIRLFEFYIDNN